MMVQIMSKDLIKSLLMPFVATIKSGPLKGNKWIIASGSRFVQGRYEPDTVELISARLTKGDVAYDVGAHVGYLTILMANLVGNEGKVIAFEPRPVNYSYLTKHLRINNVGNVECIKKGVSDVAGVVTFDSNTGTGTGQISSKGNISIETICLDDEIDNSRLPPPNFIKMDIEGGEVDALKGSHNLLTKYKPILHISTHGEDIHAQCIEYIKQHGYSIEIEDRHGFVALHA